MNSSARFCHFLQTPRLAIVIPTSFSCHPLVFVPSLKCSRRTFSQSSRSCVGLGCLAELHDMRTWEVYAFILFHSFSQFPVNCDNILTFDFNMFMYKYLETTFFHPIYLRDKLLNWSELAIVSFKVCFVNTEWTTNPFVCFKSLLNNIFLRWTKMEKAGRQEHGA